MSKAVRIKLISQNWVYIKRDIMLSTMHCVPAPVSQSVECPLLEWEITGSIPGCNIPKSLKMVLAALHLALRLTG